MVVGSALCSGTETGLTSLEKFRIRSMMEEHPHMARAFGLWLERPGRVLTTVVFGNTLMNVGASALATIIVLYLLTGGARQADVAEQAAAIATGATTFLILVFGEIAPKTWARRHPELVAVWTILPLAWATKALGPITSSLLFLARAFIRLLGGKVDHDIPLMTEEDIKTIVEVGEKEGVLEEDEREMIDSIFEFGDTRVLEVMVPRTDMLMINADDRMPDIVRAVIEAGHSRVPVYQETVDAIIGILYAKDLLTLWDRDDRDRVSVRDLLRPPYIVPETKYVSELLQEFRREHIHIAVVVDEYGGTAGLVTIEDLLEEIVGEIQDEYDEEPEEYRVVSPEEVVVDARMAIDQLNHEFGADIPEAPDVETMGGFVVHSLGHVPAIGEKVSAGGIEITVTAADDRRVQTLRIKRVPPPQAGGPPHQENSGG